MICLFNSKCSRRYSDSRLSSLLKSRKAQTSAEFVILTSFMIMVFLVFYIVIQSKLTTATLDTANLAAKQVETLVVNELKMAESVTVGYYREFELPQKINGVDYTISVMSGVNNTPEIVIKYSGKERVYFVPQVYIGNSTVGKGKNNITKTVSAKGNSYIKMQHME